MRFTKVAGTAFAALLLAACQNITNESPAVQKPNTGFTPITTRAQFVADVAGRKVAEGPGYFVIQSNGAINGIDTEGEPYTGVWTWKIGAWCRAFDTESGRTEEKCRTIAVSETKIRFTKLEDGEAQYYDWQ